MAVLNCECRYSCTGLAVVSALILGIIAAFLQITGVVALTPAFLWVVLGIAVVYLAVLLATSSCGQCTATCGSCRSRGAVLAGILGTVVLGVILLGIPAVTDGVIGAIFSGALLFFFFLIIFATACLVRSRCAD